MPDTAISISVLECTDCGSLDPGPREICPNCQGDQLHARNVAGDGELISWTIIRRPPTAFRQDGEYAVAVVKLNQGVQVTGRLDFEGNGPAPGVFVHTTRELNGVPVFIESG